MKLFPLLQFLWISNGLFTNQLINNYGSQVMLKEIIPEIKDFAVLISNEEIQSQLFYHIDFFCDSIKTIYEVILIKNDAYGFQSGIFMKQQ